MEFIGPIWTRRVAWRIYSSVRLPAKVGTRFRETGGALMMKLMKGDENGSTLKTMATLEQVINEVRTLSPTEKRTLRQVLDDHLEEPPSTQVSTPDYPTHEKERAWLEAHRDEYLGEWVALDGDRLLAHGSDARIVYEAARAKGVEAPFVERVQPKVDAFMGGWL